MAKSKREPLLRFFLVFTCIHCGSDKHYVCVYRPGEVTNQEEAERWCRAMHCLAPSIWRVTSNECKEE